MTTANVVDDDDERLKATTKVADDIGESEGRHVEL